MKKDIEKAVLDLQVWINNEFNLLLKNLPKFEVVGQLEVCIDSFKYIKQLTNGQQRFLKDLLKMQEVKKGILFLAPDKFYIPREGVFQIRRGKE